MDDVDDEPGPPPVTPGPGGPDLYSLLAWAEVEVAAFEAGAALDAAHAVITDLISHVFGRRVFDWVGEALVAEGRDGDDLAGLRADEFLARRVFARLLERMADDDDAPDPPDADGFWSAYEPGDPAGSRERFRRARRERRQHARAALVFPPRPEVAGQRGRNRR